MTTISGTSQKQQEQFASLILKPYDVNCDRSNRTNNNNDNNNDDVTPFLTSLNHRNVVTLNSKGKWCISSYYFDSYGGANITLPLQLQFPSKDMMDSFLFNKNNNNNSNANDGSSSNSSSSCCIQPKPTNLDDYMKQNGISLHQEQTVNQEKKNIPRTNHEKKVDDDCDLFMLPVVGIEAKVTLTFGTGHAMTSKVETVQIISTYIDSYTNSILFYTNIIVRVSHVENHMITRCTETTTNNNIHGGNNNNNNYDHSIDSSDTTTTTTTTTNTMIIDPIEASKMKLNLEIMASYYYYYYYYSINSVPTTTNTTFTNVNHDDYYDSALQLLSSSTNYHHHQQQQQGQSSSSSSSLSLSPIQMKKLVPVPLELYVSLLHTLHISNPRTITHPTNMGETYIAFTMTHANNIHSDPIHITNITLHPHFSSSSNSNKNQKKNILFKWGFVKPTITRTTSDSPLSSASMNQNRITTIDDWNTMTIYPHESQSILLFVEQQSTSPPPLPIQNIVSNNDNSSIIIIDDHTSFSCHCTLTISTKTMATNTTTSSISAEAVYTTNITYMATPTTTTTGSSVPTTTTTTNAVISSSTKASDVFHISMSLEQSQCATDENSTSMHDRHSNNIVSLGKPFLVNIDVLDPPTNHQQLLKLVVLDPQKRNTQWNINKTNTTGQQQSNNDENISPIIQRGLPKQHLGNDLLMIDTDVLLELLLSHRNVPKEGSHPTAAATTTSILRGQLRMIPLRTGTIMIPNFYIMDTSNGNVYYCYHKFQAIVQ